MLDLMWPLLYFIGFQIFLDGCILRAIILEALASVGFVDVWRVKIKAKEGKNPIGSIFSW